MEEERFQSADLRDIPATFPAGYRALARRLLAMLEAPQLLAVCGIPGRGKTHLACGLIRAFCGCGLSALYRRTRQIFDKLTSTAWEGKEKYRESLIHPDLLVLDEVSFRDGDKEWQNNELATLIDRRYARQRSTLLLSNLRPDDQDGEPGLRSNLGPSIMRRLIETGGQPIETNWPRIEEVIARNSQPQPATKP
jgi:DNA replication protein DnaC